ncbi:non-specific lipid-transfer protein 2-like [Nicotiana tomentosiformis]|uniref:Non-specific lipid-transfer protein 2-like n=1 Tax=Nicotiana tabacum TaxID=4097 RepID=A0A1S4CRL3_TOBAC|nr:non-specific lipid-transfer protein 2-like [Nicotiana tomentosiformis]XP_016503753.1 PREDICTED: non-specific lipid-transfer protein 2-like [Nicotiana tabacum]
MKKGCSLVAVMLVVVLIGDQLGASEAVTCSATQLSPCLGAITSGTPPSQACCARLRGQQPCLCGYMRDPNLRQYVNSPNARKVASSCGVSIPSC